MRALAIDSSKALDLGDVNGAGHHDALCLRIGSDALPVRGFEA